MSRRTISLTVIIVTLLVLPPTAVFYLAKWIERQRIADAEPAFRPILQLQPIILSQPISFHRYCRYVVDFPAESKLSDDNNYVLNSLNQLPSQCTLDLTIRTTQVTDASIPVLENLKSVDLLSVDESAISDAGETRLREKLKDRFVSLRK